MQETIATTQGAKEPLTAWKKVLPSYSLTMATPILT
jgi:hypothetical protein